MAEVAAFMFALAVCRGVNVVMENPPRSYIWEYLNPHFSPYGFLVDVVVDRCAFDDTRGRKIGKKYMFRASGPWIQTLSLGLLMQTATPPMYDCDQQWQIAVQWK